MDETTKKTLSDIYSSNKKGQNEESRTYDGYYVYMLCDESSEQPIPFYVGKGKYDRICQHENETELQEIECENFREELKANDDLSDEEIDEIIKSKKEEISEKCKRIKELSEKGKLGKYIIKWGLTEHEAYMAESALINAYSLTNGRKNSLKNIVNGHMSNREKTNRAKTTKAWSLAEFGEKCAVEKKDISSVNESVVFITLNSNTYSQCFDNPDKLYEISRGFWKIADDRIKDIKYAVMLYVGQVVAIYKINWIKTRAGFIKDVADEEQLREMFKHIIMYFGKEDELKYMWKLKGCSTFEEVKKQLDENDLIKFCEKMELYDDEHNVDEVKIEAWLNRKIFDGTLITPDSQDKISVLCGKEIRDGDNTLHHRNPIYYKIKNNNNE